MELGVHELVHPNESFYDQLRRQWAAQFGNVTVHKSNTQPISADNTNHSEGESSCPSALPMGWALHGPASKSRFPDCVKLYLKAKFDLGERTGEKADSQQVPLDMRNTRWMEELESLEEEQERCSLLEAVESQMGVTHPIIYDTYDLCECNEQNLLNSC
jgi:hypothetical protein